MFEWLDKLLQSMIDLPAPTTYLLLALAAALENIVPPIPADVVVLFGGFLAGQGGARVELVFVAVWLGNVAGALFVFGIGRRFGPGFFSGRWGQLLLQPRQLASLDLFYRRFGPTVIFVSRFLPMFRAVTPVFAGVAGLGLWRTAAPIAAASAIWYGLIVYVGSVAGANWNQITAELARSSRWLGFVALLLGVLILGWWWQSRRSD
jgi:membrane protein DedA with SNARE-associated domain